MFERLFLLSGLLFLVVLPLLVFLRSPDHESPGTAEKKPIPDAHVEI
jgi:hypothetical protein